MATNESNTMNADNGQAIGTAVIVSGSVQAEAPDGSIRLLQVNGVVFANETIITGGNGKVSIIFNDAGQTQLDLGRMSEVTLDEDVFQGAEAVDLDEVALEVEQMQEALLQGDPTQDLPAPAAGPAGGVLGARGGGHPTVVFDLTADEVTPESGAETIGVSRSFVDPDRPLTQEIAVPLAVAPEPLVTVDGIPLAGNYENYLDEEHLADGTNPIPELMTTYGDLGDMGVVFGPDGPGTIQFGSQILAIDNLGGAAVDSIFVSGAYGNLTFYDNGTWSFNVPDNIYHPIPGATGAADSLPDVFGFTITDGNGTAASGTMTFNIWDDGPILSGVEADRVVEEEVLDNYDMVGDYSYPGYVIIGSKGIQYEYDGTTQDPDGPEDLTQPDATVVNGSIAPLVIMGADNPGTFSIGILDNLPGLVSQGGEVLYRLNANGTTIEAYVEGYYLDDGPRVADFSETQMPEGFDRLVFTLDIQSNGDYELVLYDQLDHVLGDGENTLLQLWGGGEVAYIDFSTAIMAIDSDLDPITFPEGLVTFTVVDDIPRLVEVEYDGEVAYAGILTGAVQEDALGQDNLLPANNPDADYSLGNLEDLTDTDQTELWLNDLVDPGADEHLTWSMSDPAAASSGLTSDNAPVYYHLVEVGGVNVLVATTSATAPTGTFTTFDDLPENIFTFSVTEDGKATFNLNDQLDHGDPGDDGIYGTADDIEAGDAGTLVIDNLGQYVLATDYDGDSVALTDRIEITVENDVPMINPRAIVDGFVEEDALSRSIIGTAEYPPDNSEGNPDDWTEMWPLDIFADTDSSLTSGSLSQLVEDGADEDVSFSVVDSADAIAYMESQGLTSQGKTLEYNLYNTIGGTVLTASTSNGTVFTLWVGEDGNWAFDLDDQLDHVDDGTNSQNTALQSTTLDGVDHIDFSGLLIATDTDGDMVQFNDGQFFITIEDDIPVATCWFKPVGGLVLEDGLSIAEGDGSEGNREDGEDTTDDETSGVAGSLTQLFSVGADDFEGMEAPALSMGIINDDTYLNDNLATLYSQGELVTYSTNGTTDTLTATAGTRVVFTLTVDEDGSWEFDMIDQLDHVDNGLDDENRDLLTDGDPVDGIDFSAIITAEDYDGDMAIGAVSGAFVIQVEDDIPITDDPQYAILANEAGNNLVADLAIEFGADEPGTMVLNPHADNMLWDEDSQSYLVIDDNGTPVTYQGIQLVWLETDGSWSGVVYLPTVNNLTTAESTDPAPLTIFTVALEMDGDEYTGNYTVELFEELDGATDGGEFSFDFTKGGGHAEERIMMDGDVRVVVTAQDPDHDPDVVNWNSQGMGVGNTFINEDYEPGKDGDFMGSEVLIINFTDSQSGDALLMNSATFLLDHLDEYQQGNNNPDPEEAHWTAYDELGNVVGTGFVTGEDQGSTWKSDKELTIDETNTTGDFCTVEFTAETTNPEGYRVLTLDGSYEESLNEDLTLSFVVDGEDFDGDAFDQQEFDVTFVAETEGDCLLPDYYDIDGTDHAEVISGSTEGDVIDGGGGDDVIYANEGIDLVAGGEGDDLIFGGDDGDILAGGEGDDVILGGDGVDLILGGEGDDILEGDGGTDVLSGGDGDDILDGGAGAFDVLAGDDGADELYGGPGPLDILISDSEDTVVETDGSYDSTEDIDNLIDPPVEV